MSTSDPIADMRDPCNPASMTGGGSSNWIIVVAMLAAGFYVARSRGITFRNGTRIDFDKNPRSFWLLVFATGIVGLVFFYQVI